MSVLASTPASVSAPTICATPSSTASSDSSRCSYDSSIAVICAGVSRGWRAASGLSETSRSSNDGGGRKGSPANASRCRAAGRGLVMIPGARLSSASNGPPACGAKYASQRKNGEPEPACCQIWSTALSVKMSVW